MIRLYALILLSVIILSSCAQKEQVLNGADYVEWINNPDNGLILKKEIDGIQLTFQYLPKVYQAYQELLKNNLNPSQENLDSLVKSYKEGITILIKVNGTKSTDKAASLVYFGVNDEMEYKQRIQLLSFRMHEYLYMERNDTEFRPTLVNYDGHNELVNEIKFLAVFPTATAPSDTSDFEITFEDPFWETGTNHFVFDKKIIAQVPGLQL